MKELKKKTKLKWAFKKDVHYTNVPLHSGFQIIKYGKSYKTKNFLLTNKNMETGWFDKLKDAKKCAQIIHEG